jgi:hypothetical protein
MHGARARAHTHTHTTLLGGRHWYAVREWCVYVCVCVCVCARAHTAAFVEVCGLELLVRMRPYAASVCGLVLIGYEALRCCVCGLKLLVRSVCGLVLIGY